MRESFERIYKELSDFYRLSFSVGFSMPITNKGYIRFIIDSIEWINDAIESSIKKFRLEDRVRSDAKHFLLINFHQMVVMPIINPRNEHYPVEVNSGELHAFINEDINEILYTASTKEDADRQITGTSLIKVLPEMIDSLRISKLEIWG